MPHPFERLEGRHIAGGYTLHAAQYDNGRGALEAMAPDGSPECRITVNLVDEMCEPGEFFVRIDAKRFSQPVFDALVTDQIAEPTGEVVPSGRVARYGERWRLLP